MFFKHGFSPLGYNAADYNIIHVLNVETTGELVWN